MVIVIPGAYYIWKFGRDPLIFLKFLVVIGHACIYWSKVAEGCSVFNTVLVCMSCLSKIHPNGRAILLYALVIYHSNCVFSWYIAVPANVVPKAVVVYIWPPVCQLDPRRGPDLGVTLSGRLQGLSGVSSRLVPGGINAGTINCEENASQ